MQKYRNRFAEQLFSTKTAISALPPGPERIHLEIAVEELQSKLEHEHKNPVLEWIKTLGAVLIPLGVIWTLYQGISEYGRAVSVQEREPFIEALSNLSDSTSPAKRASALAALYDYHERYDFNKTRKGEALSLGKRVAMALALQAIEERSPALRVMMIESIGDLCDDSSMSQLAFQVLAISNLLLTEDLRTAANQEERLEIKRKLKSSGWAIGRLVRIIPESDTLDTVFGIKDFVGDRSLALTLNGADLCNLDFGELDFSGADFSGSIVRGADLSKATLDSPALKSLCSAQGIDQAILNAKDRAELSAVCNGAKVP